MVFSKPMTGYLLKAATAVFLGFTPYFEIYLAVPAAIALGLDYFSAVFWSVLGNFLAVPVVVLFFEQIMRVPLLRRMLQRRMTETNRRRLDRYGPVFVLLMAPLVGIWVVAALAKAAGMRHTPLFISSLVSIVLYAALVAALIALGIDVAGHIPGLGMGS